MRFEQTNKYSLFDDDSKSTKNRGVTACVWESFFLCHFTLDFIVDSILGYIVYILREIFAREQTHAC